MILVKTPLGQFSKLVQWSMRVFDDLGGHKTDFILLGTSLTNDAMPFTLLLFALFLILTLSPSIELLYWMVFQLNFKLTLLLWQLFTIVVSLHFDIYYRRTIYIIFDCWIFWHTTHPSPALTSLLPHSSHPPTVWMPQMLQYSLSLPRNGLCSVSRARLSFILGLLSPVSTLNHPRPHCLTSFLCFCWSYHNFFLWSQF